MNERESTPRSRAASLNLWAPCALSRVIVQKRARHASLPRVRPPLYEILRLPLTRKHVMSLCSTGVLGIVGALIMYLGAREVLSLRLDIGGYVEYILLLAFMVAPVALNGFGWNATY